MVAARNNDVILRTTRLFLLPGRRVAVFGNHSGPSEMTGLTGRPAWAIASRR